MFFNKPYWLFMIFLFIYFSNHCSIKSLVPTFLHHRLLHQAKYGLLHILRVILWGIRVIWLQTRLKPRLVDKCMNKLLGILLNFFFKLTSNQRKLLVVEAFRNHLGVSRIIYWRATVLLKSTILLTGEYLTEII